MSTTRHHDQSSSTSTIIIMGDLQLGIIILQIEHFHFYKKSRNTSFLNLSAQHIINNIISKQLQHQHLYPAPKRNTIIIGKHGHNIQLKNSVIDWQMQTTKHKTCRRETTRELHRTRAPPPPRQSSSSSSSFPSWPWRHKHKQQTTSSQGRNRVRRRIHPKCIIQCREVARVGIQARARAAVGERG